MIKGCKVAAGCYSIPSVPSKYKHHQTEKPVELMMKLLELVPAGGTVLDLFMGSGSTGVACVRKGINFYGIELDPGYFQMASERIEGEKEDGEQMTLEGYYEEETAEEKARKEHPCCANCRSRYEENGAGLCKLYEEPIVAEEDICKEKCGAWI